MRRGSLLRQRPVEVLGHYSKHGDGGNSASSLIEQVARCRSEAVGLQIPSEIQTPSRPRIRILTPAEIKHLVAAYEAGDSTHAIARQFGIRRETVTAHLERNGILRRVKHRVEIDAATHRMIIELRTNGTSVTKIAKRFGLTDRVVAGTLDSTGVARRRVVRTKSIADVANPRPLAGKSEQPQSPGLMP